MLCNDKISNFATLIDIIQESVNRGQPLVIIAESFDTSVTQGLALNIIRSGGQLKVACVEAPGYGDSRLDRLRDMAVYLGADVAGDPMGIKFENMSSASFGSCEKIIIKKDETVIRGGKGDEAKIKARVDAISGMIKALPENDTFEREKLNKRLAALTTGIAVIQVGGSSEEEIAELRDRLEDATFAVKAALEEGYLPGGGNSLLYLSEDLLNNKVVDYESKDEALGGVLFANALKAPFNTILENAGVSTDIVMKDVLSHNDINVGYNAKTLKIENFLETGIIDPVKVVKGAVYAASSIASVILTSSVMICTDPVENKGVNLNMMTPGMM